HLRVDNVVNPGARDGGSNVSRILLEHRIERFSGFPVLVPALPAAERAQLQPDVIEIDLAQKKQRRFVTRGRVQLCARQGLTSGRVAQEGCYQVGALQTALEGLFLVGLLPECVFELEKQCGCAELIARQILGVRRPQRERQHGSGAIAAVVEQLLRVHERQTIERYCGLFRECLRSARGRWQRAEGSRHDGDREKTRERRVHALATAWRTRRKGGRIPGDVVFWTVG